MKLPYAEVEFDEKGALVEPDQIKDVEKVLQDTHATDVVVVCHGWNNTKGQARALYERLVDSIADVRPKVAGARERRIAVIGMLWPSIQWAPPESDGAGAGVGDEAAALEADIVRQVADPKRRRKLLKLVPELENSATARRKFVELLRADLPAGATDDDDPDSAPQALRDADAETVLSAASGADDDDPAAGPAAGGAAVIDPAGLPPLDDGGEGAGFSLGGIFDAVRNVLNVTTYFTMKERAGVVGKTGIAPLLETIHADSPDARIHLVGHSFGGRAVTAAADATSAPVSSLCLLQAAYSHYGMAQKWDGVDNGLFWRVPGKVDGPVVVTFTRNDKAVGLAYPVASRIARQIGAGLGDADDKYGGIGRNGALKTPASLPPAALQAVGGTYAFRRRKVSSLNADAFIKDHGDVTGREVAYAVLSAIMTTKV